MKRFILLTTLSTFYFFAKGQSKIDNLSDTNKISTLNTKDSLSLPQSSSALKSEVKYTATDSIIYDIDAKKIYLFGKAKINYEDIQLDADRIWISWDSSQIYAEGAKDSLGIVVGTPIFTQGEHSYKSHRMTYNFKSKKGKIYDLITEESGGFIHSDEIKVIKKNDTTDVMYAKDARYTTCENESPHFYIQTNKLKLIPKDKIITGKALMYIEDVPTPLFLPFGFFPAHEKKASGFIFNGYGEENNRGFFLNAGYYFTLSKYYDLSATGAIYTNGSWQTNFRTNFAKRYKYSGNFSLDYANLVQGLRETSSFQKGKDARIQLNYTLDSKARPGVSFSSNVNLSTTHYNKYFTHNQLDRLSSTTNSSINYGKQFSVGNVPMNFALGLRHSQNNQTGIYQFDLPEANYSISRLSPFKTIKGIVRNHWYNNLGLTYNIRYKDFIETSDSQFLEGFRKENLRQGITHSIPLSTSIKLGHFNLSPSINYNGFIYFDETEKKYWGIVRDSLGKGHDSIVVSKNSKLNQANVYNLAATLNTHLYGTFKIKAFGIEAIRHVFTPSISGILNPDFSDTARGYWKNYIMDSLGRIGKYSKFETGIYGGPAQGKSGSLNFSFNNNFEMKVKNKSDTITPYRKVKLIDNLNLTGNYNFLADSFRLSNIGINGSTSLFNKITINGNMNFNPYKPDLDKGRLVDEYAFRDKGSLATLTSANLSMGTSLNSKSRDKAGKIIDPRLAYLYPGMYADFEAPWNATLSYTMNYSKNTYAPLIKKDFLKDTIKQSINLSGSLQLTKAWDVQAGLSYDINAKKIAYPNINFTHDMHCWEMTFNWIPAGTYKEFTFNIHVKAPTLKDLKIQKRRSFYDNY